MYEPIHDNQIRNFTPHTVESPALVEGDIYLGLDHHVTVRVHLASVYLQELAVTDAQLAIDQMRNAMQAASKVYVKILGRDDFGIVSGEIYCDNEPLARVVLQRIAASRGELAL